MFVSENLVADVDCDGRALTVVVIGAPCAVLTVQSTIFLRDVPRLSRARHNEARRFVTLMDQLYECGVTLHCSVAAPLSQLFGDLDDGSSAVAPRPSHTASRGLEDAAAAAVAVPVPAGVQLATVDSTALSEKATTVGLDYLGVACRRARSRLVEVCIDVLGGGLA